jgi:autotransporter-associated beta strand protein
MMSAGNLTVGSFDVTGSSGTFSIRNETTTATDRTLILGGSGDLGNSVSGTAADLLYVASGASFVLRGDNGSTGAGVLKVQLGQSGNFNAVGTLNIGAAISDGGSGFGFTKTGAGTLTLTNANNTYRGNTTISEGTLKLGTSGSINNSPNIIVNGTFDVSGVTGGSYSLASGQTLKGSGAIKGTVVVASGATLSPGSSIGTITFNSAPTFSGTNLMEIDRNGGSPLADKIALSSGTLAYGGALTVNNLGPALQNGDRFTLFTVPGNSFSSWFSTVTLPALASGLSWDTNKLATSGVLDVYSFTTNSVQTMSTPKNTAANLLIAKLLSKAGSSRGTVALASVSASSAQGGAVAINGSNITYTPPTSAFTGGDSFNCVLSDGHGSITATVVVTVTDPNNPNQTSNGSNLAIRVLDGGGVRLIIAGTADKDYQLQYTDSISPPNWQNLGSAFTMPAGGIKTIDDSGGSTLRYYRTTLP